MWCLSVLRFSIVHRLQCKDDAFRDALQMKTICIMPVILPSLLSASTFYVLERHGLLIFIWGAKTEALSLVRGPEKHGVVT